jgi:hypothetical protein
MPTGYQYKVELEGTDGFILDTDLLDTGLLGYVPTDVTSYVRSVNVRTGRSTIQDQFTAGQMSVVFDNRSRAFDPNYSSSPLYGAIVPRRRINFYIGSYATTVDPPELFFTPIFVGTVDSWSFEYDVSGESTATASCSDAFTVLSRQNIVLTNPPAELTETRITRVLTDSSVAWPVDDISIGGCAFTVGTASYTGDVLSYLQQLVASERGYLFANVYGDIQVRGWREFVSTNLYAQFTDSGNSTDIPFTSIETTYDTDLFANYVTVSGYPGTVTYQDTTSQQNYGISAQDFPSLLSSTGQMAYVGTFLRNKYGNPRFRVAKVTVSLDDPIIQNSPQFIDYGGISNVTGLTIGYYVNVSWTPNRVGTQVSQNGYIIGIDVSATPERCEFTFSLSGDEVRGDYP